MQCKRVMYFSFDFGWTAIICLVGLCFTLKDAVGGKVKRHIQNIRLFVKKSATDSVSYAKDIVLMFVFYSP